MTEDEQKEHDEAVARVREGNSKMNTDRLKLLERIADGADEVRAEDFGAEVKDDAAEAEARAAEEERHAAELMAKGLQEEGVETEPEPVKEADSDTKVVNGETYYRQIVNGREKWQTLKEIRQTAQKVDGADEYLRQAAESVRNASRLALSPKDEPSKVEEVDLRALLRGVALGEEEAIEKLTSFLQTRPSEVTPDVVRTIDQRLSFRTELASLEAKSKDLLENPYTKRLFRDRLNELKEENAEMSLSEAYASIDQELRAAFPGLTKAKTQDKLERKRTLPQVPSAASRQVVVDEEEGEEDPAEVIKSMAKARGFEPHIYPARRQ